MVRFVEIMRNLPEYEMRLMYAELREKVRCLGNLHVAGYLGMLRS